MSPITIGCAASHLSRRGPGTKTVGGAIASAVFAIALAATGSLDAAGDEVAPLNGHLTVWAVCS